MKEKCEGSQVNASGILGEKKEANTWETQGEMEKEAERERDTLEIFLRAVEQSDFCCKKILRRSLWLWVELIGGQGWMMGGWCNSQFLFGDLEFVYY